MNKDLVFVIKLGILWIIILSVLYLGLGLGENE